MKKCSSMAKSSVEVEDKHCATVFWRIQNVEKFHPRVHRTGVWTPWITIRSLDISKCCFYLKLDNRDNLSLTFYMAMKLDFAIDCEFSFLASDDTPLITRTVRNWEIESPFGVMMPDCPTREEMFWKRMSEYMSTDKSINMRCRIWKSAGIVPFPEVIWLGSKFRIFYDSFKWTVAEIQRKARLENSFRIAFLDEANREVQSFQVECWLISNRASDTLRDFDVGFNVMSNNVSETLLLRLQVILFVGGTEKLPLANKDHLFEGSTNPLPWGVKNCGFPLCLRQEMSSFRVEQGLDLVFQFTGYYKRLTEVGRTHFGFPNVYHGRVNVLQTDEPDAVQCPFCRDMQPDVNIPHNLLRVRTDKVDYATATKRTEAVIFTLLKAAQVLEDTSDSKKKQTG